MNDDGLLLVVKNEREARLAEKLGFSATSDRDALGRWTEVLRDGLIAITKSIVKFVWLPNSRSLAGWLDSGGTREDLLRLIDEAPEWEPREIENVTIIPTPDEDERESPEKAWPNWPYLVMGGRICWGKKTIVGPEIQCLCNFDAAIVEDLIRDDGSEGAQTGRTYKVEGKLASGEQLPTAYVPATQFRSMNWIEESWGSRANVTAGNGNRDKLREAIKELSKARERRLFCHTGWRRIDEKWFFLIHGGAIGPEGFTNEFDVDLGELRAYSCGLPAQRQEDSRAAIEASLRLLDVGPLAVTAPLWAAIFRAPLAHILPADFTLWLEAPTGRLKSTLSALFLNHFGPNFSTTRLPGSWRSTANSLERSAHMLKDVVFVVDDFSHDDHGLHDRALNFCRAQGNLSGRGRLGSNLSERPAFRPRGITLSTGEVHPSGERSLLARTPVVEVPPGAIDINLLSNAQAQSELLSRAMSGYLRWLAERIDTIAERLPQEFREARSLATTDGQLLRISEVLANLWIGFDYGLRYAQEVGAISDENATKLRDRCLAVFLDLGRDQDRLVQGEQPIRLFLEGVSVLIDRAQLVLQPKNSSVRKREKERNSSAITGHVDAELIYLPPDVTFGAVRKLSRDVGEAFPVPRNRLFKDLRDEGLTECDDGRSLKVVNLGGRERRRMLVLRRDAVDQLLGIPLWPR
jgi:hypothetical protein